jgi:GcrA cell cycle regulator
MVQWPEWRVVRLRELIGGGSMSAAEIGKELGVSKNSVIGKAERLGIKLAGHRPPRQKPKPTATPPKPKPPPPMPKPKPPPPPPPPDPLVGQFENAGHFALFAVPAFGCLWPIGDPASLDFHYCGVERQHPHPYCAEHTKLAYQPSKPRKDR